VTDQNRTPADATVTRRGLLVEALAAQPGYHLSLIASGPGRRGAKTEAMLRALLNARVEDGGGPRVVIFHHHPRTRMILRSEGPVAGPIAVGARLLLAGGPWVDWDQVISLHV
jgi:hypothetical protein